MADTMTKERSLISRTLLGTACFMVFLLGLRTISSADIWMHMAAGRHALEHGPSAVDPFSFSLPVKTAWLQTTWLYDIAIHLLWEIGGCAAVTLIHATMTALAFILMIPIARRFGNDIQVTAALILCGWLAAPLMTIRPDLLSLLFIAVFVRMTSKPAWRRNHAIVLLMLQVIWVNSAPWFLLGPAILAMKAIDSKRRYATEHPPEPGEPRAYFILSMLARAVSTITPFGPGTLIASLSALSRLDAGITLEWISPFARDFLPYPLSLLPTLALVLIATVFIFYRDNLPMVVTMLAVAATFQIVQSGHHIEINALMAFPFIVISIACLSRIAAKALKGKRVSWLPACASVAVAGALVLSLGMIITNRYYVASGSASAFGWGVNSDAFPVAAAANLEKITGKPSRMVNLSHDGGYLLWRLPGTKVFADPRGDLYGTDFFDMLSRGLVGHQESWNQLISRYDPDALLIHGTWTGAGATAARLLQGDQWIMAYFDGTSMLLVRTISSNADLINDKEGRRLGAELIEKGRQRYEGFLPNRFVRPPNPSRLIGAAAIYQASGRFDLALPLHTLLTEGSPRYVGAWINRGIAEMQAALGERAVSTMEHVTDLIPSNPIGWLWLGKAYTSVDRLDDAAASFDKARAINRLVAERFLTENPTDRHGNR